MHVVAIVGLILAFMYAQEATMKYHLDDIFIQNEYTPNWSILVLYIVYVYDPTSFPYSYFPMFHGYWYITVSDLANRN
jgi:hypothetical protein